VVIAGALCRLRPYRLGDAIALAAVAGAFEVARWMTARFPHPYTLEDAHGWVANASRESPVNNFVIEADGDLAGGAGITPHSGENLGVAEFGYWLGRDYWGRGITTEAARLLAGYAFSTRRLRRLEAHVFAPNVASVRVLEKCGFEREALLRQSYVERDGTVVDGMLFAKLAPRQEHRGA
jgi:RimJ/RimL family protein N-acetyltransferase